MLLKIFKNCGSESEKFQNLIKFDESITVYFLYLLWHLLLSSESASYCPCHYTLRDCRYANLPYKGQCYKDFLRL
jgi:hypothetical protein